MNPVLTLFGFEMSSYSVCYLVALVLFVLVLKYELSKRRCSIAISVLLVLSSVFFGIVGAKLYYLIEHANEVAQAPARYVLKIGGSGWYGGFAAAGLAVMILLWRLKEPKLATLDAFVPAVLVAQTVGRIGCYLGGCCHGVASDSLWAVRFPYGLYSPRIAVHPTQLYEALIYALVLALVWVKGSRPSQPGTALGMYLLLAGGGRFVVEFLRLNSDIGIGLTAPQVFSLAEVIAGTILLSRWRSSDIGHLTSEPEVMGVSFGIGGAVRVPMDYRETDSR